MKKFTTFFLALSLSMVLAGCGSTEKETESTTTEAATTESTTTEAVTTEEATTEETTTEAATTEEVTTEAATTEAVTTEAATTEIAAETESTTTEAFTETEAYTGFYILNDDTREFHKSDCELTGQIPQAYFVMSTYSREELVDEKYYPCDKCNP